MIPTQPIPPAPKRHWIRNTLLALGGLLALIIGITLAAGGGSQQHATPAPATATDTTAPAQPAAAAPTPDTFSQPIGTPITIHGSLGDQAGAIAATNVRLTTQPAESFGSPPANGQYVIVTITATAAAGKQLDVNALDWYAKVNGQHFDYAAGNAMQAISSSKMLTAATLHDGESTTGQISFDVPASHGEIVYAPNYSSAPIASWKF